MTTCEFEWRFISTWSSANRNIFCRLRNREEDEGEDEVDSDFSIDENDEPVSDPEQEGPKKKRRLVTKAYKEPKPTSTQAHSTPKEKKAKIPKARRTSVDNSGALMISEGI